jgi:hypothetical protein
MNKYTFVYEHTDIFTEKLVTKLTMETHADSLNSILEEFENFLKGAGFVIDGRLDVVSDDYKFDDEYEFDDETDDDNSDDIWNDTDDEVTPSFDTADWPFETKESSK